MNFLLARSLSPSYKTTATSVVVTDLGTEDCGRHVNIVNVNKNARYDLVTIVDIFVIL